MSEDVLIEQRDELLESLKGMVRIVQALGYSNVLGKTQADRMRNAVALIKKIEGES